MGYKLLQNKQFKVSNYVKQKAILKHIRPKSRFHLAKRLFSLYKISACMDITDGFNQDLEKLCSSSKIGANINLEEFPKDLEKVLSIEEILSSGEELELLFTSKENLPKKIAGSNIYKVGKTTKNRNKIAYFHKNKHVELDFKKV